MTLLNTLKRYLKGIVKSSAIKHKGVGDTQQIGSMVGHADLTALYLLKHRLNASYLKRCASPTTIYRELVIYRVGTRIRSDETLVYTINDMVNVNHLAKIHCN